MFVAKCDGKKRQLLTKLMPGKYTLASSFLSLLLCLLPILSLSLSFMLVNQLWSSENKNYGEERSIAQTQNVEKK